MSKTLSLRKPPQAAAEPARKPAPQRPPAGRAPAPRAQAPKAWPKPGATDEGPFRLNKRLADLGLCSRREGDEWIERGWVKVNGQVAQMGQQVMASDRIDVLPQATAQQGGRVTILLHKPIGYVSGLPEDGHQSAAVLVQPRTRWRDDRSPRKFEAGHTRGLAPAGRLDIDSTGLLVLTQDGRVAKALIGEQSEVEKEYLVRVHLAPNGPKGVGLVTQNVQAAFLPEKLALLRHGLSLDGQPLKPAQVDWQNPEQLRFVLTEGKKRQIRRMCEQVGLHVVGLKRIRIGRIVLGNLPLGQWRYLGDHERF
jgi:23S rRNA pseudouridine2604 synthase